MNVVHFQDLSLTFDRTDPYLFFDVSYDHFHGYGTLIHSIQFLKNSWIGTETNTKCLFFSLLCMQFNQNLFMNVIEKHIYLQLLLHWLSSRSPILSPNIAN